MSGYHKLTGPYKIRTLKNWLLCFGWFSVCEILVKLTLYWVVQLISAGWRLLCAKCMPGKVGKPFNSWPVAMEASKSVIFLPKTKEISGKNGKWQKAEFFGLQTCFPIWSFSHLWYNFLTRPAHGFLTTYFLAYINGVDLKPYWEPIRCQRSKRFL